jgi:hypothetical protein
MIMYGGHVAFLASAIGWAGAGVGLQVKEGHKGHWSSPPTWNTA